jgi:peptidyl-prolyl cis-trans isomerase SurA
VRNQPKISAATVRVFAIAILATAAMVLGAMPIGAQELAADGRVASAGPAAGAPTAADEAAEVVHHDDGVAAIVNDSVISDYDLRQRMALAITTTSTKPTPEALKALKAQVLEQLETEQLELQEAQRKNITVSPPEVDKEIDGIAKDSNLTLDKLKDILAKGGVAMSTFRAQITAQIAWRKAVQDEYQDRINITPGDIDDEMARIREGANKPHFLVAEIFLPVDSPDQQEKVLKDAQTLETQLQQGAPFQALARQFSQSPSAATGGDMGTVFEGQIAPELYTALNKMSTGTVSEPIRAAGGYYILALRQRQEPIGTVIADPVPAKTVTPGMLELARVLLPISPKSPKDYVENVLQGAAQIREHIANCEMLPKMVAAIRGAVYMNLGEMKLADLSAQIQGELSKTGPGETTEPFVSPAGVELFVRCDKAAPKKVVFQMPSRDDVDKQLFERQITVLVRRYVRDLRREANVETR